MATLIAFVIASGIGCRRNTRILMHTALQLSLRTSASIFRSMERNQQKTNRTRGFDVISLRIVSNTTHILLLLLSPTHLAHLNKVEQIHPQADITLQRLWSDLTVHRQLVETTKLPFPLTAAQLKLWHLTELRKLILTRLILRRLTELRKLALLHLSSKDLFRSCQQGQCHQCQMGILKADQALRRQEQARCTFRILDRML